MKNFRDVLLDLAGCVMIGAALGGLFFIVWVDTL